MTTSERAKLRRIDNRRHDLFSALCVVKAWLSVPTDASAEDLLKDEKHEH